MMSGGMFPMKSMAPGVGMTGLQPSACRMDSCLTTPQQELIAAYREGNLRAFIDVMNEEDLDVNKSYSEEKERTILEIAVEEENEPFLREILRNRLTDPNLSNKALKKCPLHIAAEKGNDSITKLLLDYGADVNVRMENGDTALHIAAIRSQANFEKDPHKKKLRQQGFYNVVNILLSSGNVVVDAENNIGCTPLFNAAEKGSAEVVRALLKRGACVTTEVDGETAEVFIEDRFKELVKEIDPRRNRRSNATVEDELFKALYNEASSPGSFLRKCGEIGKGVNWNSDNGNYTFLQYACDQGYDRIVEYLLDSGANPNYVNKNNGIPPLVLAGHHGYHAVIKVFKKKLLNENMAVNFSAIDNRIKRENVLHKVLKEESRAPFNKHLRNYSKCLQILLVDDSLEFKANIAAAINGPDNLGNTPLHIAAQSCNHEAVKKLLRSGANIGMKNVKGETPIIHIAPDIMEEFLDDCLTGDGQMSDENFKITFSYSFLGPPAEKLLPVDRQPLIEKEQFSKELPETEPLWYMSKIKEHKYLMNHPVITSFLWMKWRRIRPYFYMNLLMYILFMVFLTAYVLLLNIDVDKNSEPSTNNVQEIEGSEKIEILNNDFESSLSTLVIKWITFCGLVYFAIRELFQLVVSFRRYIFSVENIGEIVLIVLTFLLFFCPLDQLATKYISGIVILLSWTELVLLMGRHPRLSTYITMFNRVSSNFFRFLTWYASFIIAFGLCFFIIFHKPEGTKNDDGEEVNGYFVDPAKALMKTIVMSLTGELEFEGIEFSSHIGKIIFVLYIFFIMLVLVNLLNGLAISDISAIQKESEIVSCVSRVELISYTESVLLGDPFQFLTNFPESRLAQKLPSCDVFSLVYERSCIQRMFSIFGSNRFLLFAERLTNKQAIFYPNKSKKEKSGRQGSDELILSDEIFESAKALLVKKNTVTENEELKQRLSHIEKTLAALVEELKQNRQ